MRRRRIDAMNAATGEGLSNAIDLSACASVIDPRLVAIPEGGFSMGGDTGQESGRRYRLPTEAEWERAARGGVEQKQFPWGDEPPEHLTNYSVRWKNGPEPVGRAERNAYGLCDIGANVHEWCADWFAAEYYGASPERNPQGPTQGARKSSRGGSWRHQIKISRCAARASIPPEFQYADYGFRVVRDLRK